MIEFKEGDKFTIEFGPGRREVTVVKVQTTKVVVSIDTGGRHPILTSYSLRDFQKKIA